MIDHRHLLADLFIEVMDMFGQLLVHFLVLSFNLVSKNDVLFILVLQNVVLIDHN